MKSNSLLSLIAILLIFVLACNVCNGDELEDVCPPVLAKVRCAEPKDLCSCHSECQLADESKPFCCPGTCGKHCTASKRHYIK
ncbi:hypothetical protein DLAC_04848 [Tieghemostelium lacteum]|uniref:WAP domain-containing protein n=1 Tax=Tieghemostelium lacteum TaxID=361077 RepID=A0A151ZJ64_TIELA|nr:hypothetical protein DLAC_04848 [Tieghemostelium lacteum]|eukprot:KYQ93957.1 hypothetical protein DLAC_04848 [Tieghemostelium lacteum]